jgi:polysaccharide biosynthesis transport protein
VSQITLSTSGPSSAVNHTGAQKDLLRDIKDLVGILRRGWRYVAISIAICLTMAIIYLAKTRREYQSTARILVFQQGGRPLNVGNSDPTRTVEGDDDFVPTHMAIISSPAVVTRAIELVGLANLPSLVNETNPTVLAMPIKDAIEKYLKVSRPDRVARVVQIDYRAWSPDEANRMVTALTDSYKEFLDETFQKNSGEVVSLISKARDELSRDLSNLERSYVEFQKSHPVLVTDGSGRTLPVRRLDEWDQASSQAMIRSIQIRAQLEMGRKLSKEGVEAGAIFQALNQLSDPQSHHEIHGAGGDERSDLASGYLGKLIEEQQQLAERHGPGFSQVKAIQDQIVRTLERSREARAKYQNVAVRDLMSALEQGSQALDAMRVEYAKTQEGERKEAQMAEIAKLDKDNLLQNLERNRMLFNTVVDQLKQAQFVSDYNSVSSHLIEPSSASEKAVKPRLTMTLALALIAGCFFGTGAAFAADRLDPRIRTVEALRRTLDFAVLGQVAEVPAESASLLGEFGLIGQSKPRSAWSEAFRAVRTNLDFLRRNRRIQVILIASPHSGDGKSISSSNLAIVFAQAGRKVLLIDGDLRKPSQHRIHGLDNECGLSSMLRDRVPFSQALKRTSVENMDLLTAGPEAPNPAELLSSPKMSEFLAEARETYDLIIVDSSPLLAVTDPGIIGGLADGTILVVRFGTLKHHEAIVIREQLLVLGTPILGCLANGLAREHGGYGYGYGYGYGTPYGARTDSVQSALPSISSVALEDANGIIPHGNGLLPQAGENGFHP